MSNISCYTNFFIVLKYVKTAWICRIMWYCKWLNLHITNLKFFFYSDIFNILASSKGKSLLIVDLSTNKIKNLDFILQVTKECKNCKVLALSDNPSVELIIEVMRAGAKEFVPVPIIKNEFFEAIKKLVTEMNEPVKKNKCKIISVFSNKGGIGKTSLATNLALELAKITKENIPAATQLFTPDWVISQHF